VFDRVAGVTTLASRAAATVTTTGNGGVALFNAVALSGDGPFVAFSSSATNHVVGQVDSNGANDVFLFDRVAGTVSLVSRAPGTTTTAATGGGGSPSLSGDGSFVAFLSNGTSVVTGQVDTNGGLDVFLLDRAAGTVSLVSRAAGTTTTRATAPSSGNRGSAGMGAS
jgi:Tol biopolymer transport system component